MKIPLLTACVVAAALNAAGQKNEALPDFSLGVQATRNLAQSQTGISANLSALWHTADRSADKWLVSVKASHLGQPGNKFFSAFDKNENGNLSTLSLIGGYRVGIDFNPDLQKPYDPYHSQFFIDGQAGVAFVGTEKVSPTAVLGVGYNITPSFEINASGQWMNGKSKSIWLVGLGGAFNF